MPADVFEPPNQVFVVAYTWKTGNAAGSRREVFLSDLNAQHRVAELLDTVTSADNVRVFRLGNHEWLPLEVIAAQPMWFIDGETE